MKKILGYTIISIPFVALTIFMFLIAPMEVVITIFGSVAIAVALTYLDAYLIEDE